MTTGNTTLLGLALPVDGELDGTWGDVVNDSITSLVDSAVAGTTTLSVDADVTLTDTVLSANQARQAVILWTASNGATTRNITAPARSKPYIVINAGTGSVVLRGAGPTTGITIVSGEKCLAAWNGSDFVKVASTAISNLTGTLPVANGGTGVTTSTGTGSVVLSNSPTLVTPALGTPSSATLTNATGLPIDGGTTGTLPVARGGTGVTTSTGTGSTVLSNSPTLVTPALGTPSSGNLTNCTVDGTNAVGYRAVPSAGSAKTSNYTLTTSDIGEYVEVGSGGSITIPNATFSSGDVVSIFNNTSGGITITCSITTAYKAGTDVDQSSVTLQTRGVCTVLFISGTVCVIAGNLA